MLKNNHGSALVFVLLLLSILTILGTTMLTMGTSQTKFVSHQRNRMQAYYLARSGADAVAEYLISNPHEVEDMIDAPISKPNNELAAGSFDVEVVSESEDTIRINSTGYVEGTTQTIGLELKRLDFADLFEYAIFSSGDIDLGGMREAYGNIVSNGSITLGGVKRGEGDREISNVGYHYPSPVFPTHGIEPYPGGSLNIGNTTRTIDTCYEFTNITSNPNGRLVIETMGDTVKLITDRIDIKGRIEIRGGGAVEIYIRTSASFMTPRLINDGHPEKLFLFLDDGAILSVNSNMEFTGYVYGPKARVVEWSNAQITGGIIAGEFIANGNPSITFMEITDKGYSTSAVTLYSRGLWY